ncbi:PDZ domain-containing protein [Salinispirillum sp. LH 10-3-1]|uniref:PDZ domain-containing protein n=1 Tax=Salinispirillum sp. LH 10-3-1 TaxID=2952525 RepID=A0AB38YCR4_9GAMM
MPSYTITPADPAGHLFAVELHLENPSPKQHFWLPAWIPGSYMIRDFARHVLNMRATLQDGTPVGLQQLDKQTWVAEQPGKQALTLRYQVYAWDLSVRSAYLDQSRAFFNGSSVFLAPRDHESSPCQMTINPPSATVDGQWRVATSMTKHSVNTEGFGSYHCVNYDELIDHPVEISDFAYGQFEVEGVRHDIVLSGRHNADMTRLEQDLAKICQHHIRFWRIPAPVSHYVFMTAVLGNGGGGLEHRASTALMTSRSSLPSKGMTDTTPGYRDYLGLCSHEYFHTWNVKRLKPRVFLPYQLEQESYTELLWWFEGITSYYDDLGVLRAGCISVEHYLERLSQLLTRVVRGPGRLQQSMAESSFNAWTKFYKQDENASNAIVSYYTKGALFALYLDLTIRLGTDGKQSLDDLVRALWQRHSQDGVPEHGIPEVARDVIDCDLSAAFQLGLYGTEDLPLEPLLEQFGVQTTWGTAESLKRAGGQKSHIKEGQCSLGAYFDNHPMGAKARVVLSGSAAHKAGISTGDVIIALDHVQTDAAQIDEQIALRQPGERIDVHLFRRDELRHHVVIAEVGAATTCVLTISDKAATSRWLGV